MFGFDWNNDGKETLFDDIVTANVVYGENESKNSTDNNEKDNYK